MSEGEGQGDGKRLVKLVMTEADKALANPPVQPIEAAPTPPPATPLPADSKPPEKKKLDPEKLMALLQDLPEGALLVQQIEQQTAESNRIMQEESQKNLTSLTNSLLAIARSQDQLKAEVRDLVREVESLHTAISALGRRR